MAGRPFQLLSICFIITCSRVSSLLPGCVDTDEDEACSMQVSLVQLGLHRHVDDAAEVDTHRPQTRAALLLAKEAKAEVESTASAEVESTATARSESKAGAEAESNAKAESESKAEVESKAKAEAESKTNLKATAESESKVSTQPLTYANFAILFFLFGCLIGLVAMSFRNSGSTSSEADR
mmetsp:Transcript_37908/g.85488  ORF Transcript_37908/g.85488 Transcript_37908/m.85488 type:complete len:181 (-) Transcript_37908:76-618(-)